MEATGEMTLKGKLDVRLARLLVAGGKSGPAVVPGKTDAGEMLDRLRSGEMPPGKRKLTKEEIGVIERWIAAGAKTEAPEPAALDAGFHISAQERAFWSFQPLRREEPPAVKNVAWVKTPIDRFILARLEAAGLTPNPTVDRRQLIRRTHCRSSHERLELVGQQQVGDAAVHGPGRDVVAIA